MGISNNAVLIVGCLGGQINSDIFEANIDDTLNCASCHYDADPKNCIVGIIVATNDDCALNMSTLMIDIDNAKKKFKEITGLDGAVYIEPHIT